MTKSDRQRPAAPSAPDFLLEQSLIERGRSNVAGIDEAGRGPWAGPVVAAAVILDPLNIPAGLDDSKKLKANARDRLAPLIRQTAFVGVGIADVGRIDRDNILAATLWAMAQALAALPEPADYALIDGNRMPILNCPGETIIKGDSRSLSIAAASIIAKTARDAIMIDLAGEHPGYGWENNMGYGTRQHADALELHGVTPHHRRSFAPIKAALAQSTKR